MLETSFKCEYGHSENNIVLRDQRESRVLHVAYVGSIPGTHMVPSIFWDQKIFCAQVILEHRPGEISEQH